MRVHSTMTSVKIPARAIVSIAVVVLMVVSAGCSGTVVDPFARGAAHYDKGEFDLAIADCTEVIRLDPSNALAYFGRGAAYEKPGHHDLARADYTRASQLDPSYSNPR